MSDEYDDTDDGAAYTEADLVTAATLARLEAERAGVRTLIAFAASEGLSAASVLKALGGTGAAVVKAETDDDEPTPDDAVEAAFQLAEEAAAAGEDPSDVLELLAARVGSVSKAWDESKHKRDHGKFSSTGGGAKTKTGKDAGPKKPTKTELKLQRRTEAKAAAHAHLKARAAGKVLNASEAADLIGHLAHLTHDDLKELRKAHGASFGGETRKELRVQALVKWAKNELGKKRRAQQGSALQQTVDYGGIDPQSADFKRFYGSMRDAINDGVPMAAFKRGGNGLDEIAAQMVSAGHINLPDWEDPSEHLMGLLRGRKMLNWGSEDKKHADAYAEHVAGQLDADAGATFDPNKEWDDEDPDWFRKAAAHAPKGGVSVQGKDYTGGEFIPADVMARATDEEKAAVEGRGGEPPSDVATRTTESHFETPAAFGAMLKSALSLESLKDGGAARRAAVESVAGKLPQAAVERMKRTVKSVVAYRNLDVLNDALDEIIGEESEFLAIGFYVCARGGSLHLDGALSQSESGTDSTGSHRDTLRGVYAHEIGHAIDANVNSRGGVNYELSRTREFTEAFRAELAGGQLCEYAAIDEQEGFAEFCRLLYGSDVPHETVRNKFPLVSQFFTKQGLM